jgi:hypothetical protein
MTTSLGDAASGMVWRSTHEHAEGWLEAARPFSGKRRAVPSRKAPGALGAVAIARVRPDTAMALSAHPRTVRCIPAVQGLAHLMLAGILWSPPVARAQVADVVRPDAQGDFHSVRVAGPRGSTPQRFWLVVDRDPRGLLCRDRQGRAWIALRYGSVLQLAEPEQQKAPVLLAGKPTLRVAVKPIDILHDVRFAERGKATVCRVRANSSFLAPIQAESLEQALITPRRPFTP